MPHFYAMSRHRDDTPCHSLLALVFIGLTAFATTLHASSLRRSAVVKAVSAARPAVVNIHGRKQVPVKYDTQDGSESGSQVNGMGTGTVIDERGYIITNYHVVEGVSRIRVTLADETTAVAHLVARDPETDLAIIKISDNEQFPVISLGTSADLMPGETVIAVGNAYGYEHTVTQGIISAIHRSVRVSDYQSYADLIQTDASINPGNSGGPLLNIDGEMIGMNVAVRVGAQGIGFAIPVNKVMEVAADLIAEAQSAKVAHGANVETEYDAGKTRVRTKSVRSGSPADEAGLRVGDILTNVADQPVTRRLDFERALLHHRAGEKVSLKVQRDNEVHELTLALRKGTGRGQTVADQAWEEIGLNLMPIDQDTFRNYRTRYRGGLKITSVRPGSPAAKHGLSRGDILLGLHKWETVSLDNIAYILNSAEFKANQPFKFYILRGRDTLYGTMAASFD